MPEQRSPEALRTWLESLITQVDHCFKETEALADAISLLPLAWNEEHTYDANGLMVDLTQIASRYLSTSQSHLFAARKVLTDTTH